jgi:hypothetical protein
MNNELPANLKRFMGGIINGEPYKIEPPPDTEPVDFDDVMKVQTGIYNYGGWCPPKKGAL